MVDRQDVEAARRRVAELEGFYFHLAAYVGVLVLLTVVNALNSADGWWVQWVWVGWGIGIVAHAIAVYASRPQFVVNWERRKLRELVRDQSGNVSS
jgi:hypothetical protein